MHQNRFGEANGFTSQALAPCPQGQVLAFNPLGVGFTHRVLLSVKEPQVCTPTIGVKLRELTDSSAP
jgi:hypothetical protein